MSGLSTGVGVGRVARRHVYLQFMFGLDDGARTAVMSSSLCPSAGAPGQSHVHVLDAVDEDRTRGSAHLAGKPTCLQRAIVAPGGMVNASGRKSCWRALTGR
ncbi:hypothetical protein PSPO01_01655 [Paraphaeosphaeria sporulosa]